MAAAEEQERAQLWRLPLKEAARRIVESSCREQGIEVPITDPVVIGKVAAILRGSAATPRTSTRIKAGGR
jgi:hypothetical protein